MMTNFSGTLGLGPYGDDGPSLVQALYNAN